MVEEYEQKNIAEEKAMKLTKRNPILSLVNDYLIDSPTPRNLNYMWNFGSL